MYLYTTARKFRVSLACVADGDADPEAERDGGRGGGV